MCASSTPPPTSYLAATERSVYESIVSSSSLFIRQARRPPSKGVLSMQSSSASVAGHTRTQSLGALMLRTRAPAGARRSQRHPVLESSTLPRIRLPAAPPPAPAIQPPIHPSPRRRRSCTPASDLLSFLTIKCAHGVWLFAHKGVLCISSWPRSSSAVGGSARRSHALHTHTHTHARLDAHRRKGRIERLRVQLAYGFEARTQHQLGSSQHNGGGARGRESGWGRPALYRNHIVGGARRPRSAER